MWAIVLVWNRGIFIVVVKKLTVLFEKNVDSDKLYDKNISFGISKNFIICAL